MTPSDAPRDTLPSPSTNVFPPEAPHRVTAYSPPRWASGLARWWHASFGRNAYARGPDTVRSGRKSHRFFQHLIEGEGEGAGEASRRGEKAGK
ncbi:MAG TPA: hypothetical protein VFJ16_30350 [Longimicrobium sp.]|nr:hypothetical protein [Longimicrobium sp.]